MPNTSPSLLPNWALGLCGEMGEVIEDLSFGRPVVLETGDLLWYCHAILVCLRQEADVVLSDLVAREFDWSAPCRIAELVKKHVYHFKPLQTPNIIKEVQTIYSGCLWLLGTTSVEECYRQNVTKLLERYPDGFPS